MILVKSAFFIDFMAVYKGELNLISKGGIL